MACRGVHFALTKEQEARLLSARGDDAAVLKTIQEDIESSWDAEWLCETDKAWDAIHRCLTDGDLGTANGRPPLNLCILGGDHLYGSGGYFVCFVARDLVPSVAEALSAVSRSEFEKSYSGLRATSYAEFVGDDDREYTWSYLDDIKAFWSKAAAAGRSVVFTVDQ